MSSGAPGPGLAMLAAEAHGGTAAGAPDTLLITRGSLAEADSPAGPGLKSVQELLTQAADHALQNIVLPKAHAIAAAASVRHWSSLSLQFATLEAWSSTAYVSIHIRSAKMSVLHARLPESHAYTFACHMRG